MHKQTLWAQMEVQRQERVLRDLPHVQDQREDRGCLMMTPKEAERIVKWQESMRTAIAHLKKARETLDILAVAMAAHKGTGAEDVSKHERDLQVLILDATGTLHGPMDVEPTEWPEEVPR